MKITYDPQKSDFPLNTKRSYRLNGRSILFTVGDNEIDEKTYNRFAEDPAFKAAIERGELMLEETEKENSPVPLGTPSIEDTTVV